VTAAGFEHYEVSAFAKNKHYGTHNMNYWSFGDYLRIGPRAHRKISIPNGITRMVRTRNPQVWIEQALQGQGKQISERHEVKASALSFDFTLNVLSLKEGVPNEYFTARAGLGGQWIYKPVRKAIDRGLEIDRFARTCTTDLAWRFLTDLQSLCLTDDS